MFKSKLLLALAMALSVAVGFIPTTSSAANCTIYYSSTVYGSTPVNTTTVATGPFTTNCTGSFSGSLTNLSSAWLTLQLEKQVSGTWTVVNSGYINYSGTPGTYRYTVKNTGNGNGSWQVTYNHP